MARRPRIEFQNALYHVIARGNRRDKVFITPNDYHKYLNFIARYKKRYNFKLYAYALMSNHLHLLIETGQVPLSKIMQGLQQSYTQFFNWKYGKVGHVFQGRYKAIICQKDNYLLELIRYIHLNPIRARIVKKLVDYLWISHGYYLGRRNDKLVDTDFVLKQFDCDKRKARAYYQRFIEDGLAKGCEMLVNEIIDQRILGEKDFVEKILEDEDQLINEKGVRIEKKLGLGDILTIICQRQGLLPQLVKSNVKVKEIVLVRRLFSYVARVYFGYQLKEIALFLGIDIATVTKSVGFIVEQVKKKQDFDEKDIKPLFKKLGIECTECQA